MNIYGNVDNENNNYLNLHDSVYDKPIKPNMAAKTYEEKQHSLQLYKNNFNYKIIVFLANVA